MSITGEEQSLNALTTDRKADLAAKKQPLGLRGIAARGELTLPNGTKAFIPEETKKRCKGRAVFTRARVADGPNKDTEGWVCGAFLTHRKAGAL